MNDKIQMTNDKKYNLRERTAIFGESVIILAKTIPINPVTHSIIGQLVRSSTSIGANYNEADNAESKKDFKHKIGLCKKESSETTYWLRMLAKAQPELSDQCRILWKEAHELTLIFGTIHQRNYSDLPIRT